MLVVIRRVVSEVAECRIGTGTVVLNVCCYMACNECRVLSLGGERHSSGDCWLLYGV